MQAINLIMIYYWDKKLKNRIACPESWYKNDFSKNIDFKSLSQR